MKTQLVKFGDHYFQLNSEDYSLLQMVQELYSTFITTATHEPDLLISLQSHYGSPFCGYEVIIYKENERIFYKRSDYLIELDLEGKKANIMIHNELALKHAMMNLYSTFILHHNWGLLIHASCVIENGKAHLFSGQSGAGKSTAASLSAPRQLLADEAAIIKIEESHLTIYNSPFRSDFQPLLINQPYPAGSIHLLYQAPYNRRDSVKKTEAITELTNKIFYWCHQPEEARKILSMLSTLVKEVPVYHLHFQKNNRFWELISS